MKSLFEGRSAHSPWSGMPEQSKPRERLLYSSMTMLGPNLVGLNPWFKLSMKMGIEQVYLDLLQSYLDSGRTEPFSATGSLNGYTMSFSVQDRHIFLDISQKLELGLLGQLMRTVITKVKLISWKLATWLFEPRTSGK